MFGKITRDTFISGQPAFVDEIYDLDEATFRQLERSKKVVACEQPVNEEPKAPEKPKVTAKKVGGAKAKAKGKDADAEANPEPEADDK